MNNAASEPKIIHNTEGYIEYDATQLNTTWKGWVYHYTLKDHLGNTRVTFSDINDNGYVNTSTDVKQVNNYYPFGLNMEGNWNGAMGSFKYGYNGKELNDDFGLGWNDYGARFYDAAVGRWNAIDPLAEKYASMSGYHYVENNPIRFIDPNGMQGEDWVKNKKSGQLEWRDDVKGKDDVKDSDPYTYFGAAGTEYESANGWVRLGKGAGDWSIIDKPIAEREAEAAKWNDDFQTQIRDRQGWFTFCEYYCEFTAAGLIPGSGGVGKFVKYAAEGAEVITVASEPIVVTAESIANALNGSTMKTLQSKVSLPAVKRYVEMLEKGLKPPPIKVAGGVIVDGNHRYIAGRLFGLEPQIVPGTMSSTQIDRVQPIQKIIVDLLDWGNK